MNREDRDQIERSYADLNPHLSEQNERALKKEKRRRKSIAKQGEIDATGLLGDPRFIRWLLTMFEKADILTPSFHAQEGSRQFLDGFRAFGLAMFNDLEALDKSLMVRLMLERAKTLEEKDVPDEDENPDEDER